MLEAFSIQVDHTSHPGSSIVAPQGDVDMSSSPELRTALGSAVAGGADRLIVDLEAVHYMDSSGIATLVEAMRQCKTQGSSMVLCAMNEKVFALFEIARLHQFFTIVGTVDDALKV